MKSQKARSQKKAATNFDGNSSANRFRIVVAVFVFWVIIIGVRLVDLQTTQHAQLASKAVEQRRDKHKTKPLRGSILDRNGRDLAVTLEVETLEVNPTELENLEANAYRLAKVLGKNEREMLKTLSDGRDAKRLSIPLERELEIAKVEAIKNLGIKKGLIWRKAQKRYYPNDSLAAHIVGFANREDVGQAGIEATQEKILRGDFGEITTEKDGDGNVYELTKTISQPPRSVVLTIDYAIQHTVELALKNGIAAVKAKSGAAVVINPANGEILAMANAPTFNPNHPADAKQENWTNRAVQDFYEPGSTFKLVTYSGSLEEKVVTLDTTIDASAGAIKIGKRTIKDSGRAGVLSLTDALAKSSNVAAITLGQRLGKEKLYDYMRRFGYGSVTGVELPVESRGLMYAPEKWSADSIGSVPIGYEVGVTTLQSAAAFATIANNGVRIAPHIIKELRDENGNVVSQTQPENRRVVSETTARQMRGMLEAVTERGTAKLAQLASYTTGGKTGTAHKFDSAKGKYSESKFVASFVGVAPVNRPAVVIAVMIDEPQAGTHHGGDAAAPIFADIAEQILPALHIAPDKRDENLLAKNEPQTLAAPKVAAQTAPEKPDAKSPEKTNGKMETSADAKSDSKSDKPKSDEKSKTKQTDKGVLKSNAPRERIIETKKTTMAQPPNAAKSKPPVKNKAETSAKSSAKTKGKT